MNRDLYYLARDLTDARNTAGELSQVIADERWQYSRARRQGEMVRLIETLEAELDRLAQQLALLQRRSA